VAPGEMVKYSPREAAEDGQVVQVRIRVDEKTLSHACFRVLRQRTSNGDKVAALAQFVHGVVCGASDPYRVENDVERLVLDDIEPRHVVVVPRLVSP
jgi:hypothetical protein